jgi:hypothetical protein
MRTAAKPQRSKNGPKKKFAAENLEARLTDVLEGGSNGDRDIFEEAVPAGMGVSAVSNEEKYQLIAEAAYFRSEKRSFAPGYELMDWLAAEAEIETMLSGSRSPTGIQRNGDTRPRRR